jgi:hypothetical protein
MVLAMIPAAAQGSLVRMVNVSHPASVNFEIGDQFEILIPVAARLHQFSSADRGSLARSPSPLLAPSPHRVCPFVRAFVRFREQ